MSTNIMPPGWELAAFCEQALAEARDRHRERLASASDVERKQLEQQVHDETWTAMKARFPQELLDRMSVSDVRW